MPLVLPPDVVIGRTAIKICGDSFDQRLYCQPSSELERKRKSVCLRGPAGLQDMVEVSQ